MWCLIEAGPKNREGEPKDRRGTRVVSGRALVASLFAVVVVQLRLRVGGASRRGCGGGKDCCTGNRASDACC